MKFKEAQQYSMEYLSSPSFIERVKEEDPSMLEYLPILRQINKAGMITFNSQAGNKRKGISVLNHKPYVEIERAYLYGWMPESLAEKFILHLGVETDKQAVVVPMVPEGFEDKGKLNIPFTIVIQDGKIENQTHGGYAMNESTWNMLRKESRISKSEKPVMIQCWDPKWNRKASRADGLFSDVLKVLRSL